MRRLKRVMTPPYVPLRDRPTIWKYALEVTDSQQIAMPEGAAPLSVQLQGGVVTLWAMVDPNAAPEKRTIRIYGTGHPIDRTGGLGRFLGTVQQGGLVWHVFIVERENKT